MAARLDLGFQKVSDGAPVGAVVNYQLIKKLGKTAMNAYRMRNNAIEKTVAPAL